jgi:hypothetical protein
MTNTQIKIIHKMLGELGVATLSLRKVKELVIGNPMISETASLREIAQLIYDHMEDEK